MLKVAFQGMEGAYSHQALGEYFGLSTDSMPFALSEDVFQAVQDKKANLGFVPIENSIVGNVAVNMDLFYKFDVEICGEFYLPINHCLLGIPGSKIEDIKEAYSHPIALAQCRSFLEKHKIKHQSDYDTAGAAKNIQELKDKTKAAIASELCAKFYNLEILAPNIQSTKTNITRFVSFALPENIKGLEKEKMSLYVQTDHSPGSLLNVLSIFSAYKINLTRLESRPVPENPFTYSFYIDLLCEKNHDSVLKAIQELKNQNAIVKQLGAYPKAYI